MRQEKGLQQFLLSPRGLVWLSRMIYSFPLSWQPHPRLGLMEGLIYVLLSLFSCSLPQWVQQTWLCLGFAVHFWLLSWHITLGPLVTQALGCSSSPARSCHITTAARCSSLLKIGA